MVTNDIIRNAMTVRLEAVCDRLPPEPQFAPGIRRAPVRRFNLSRADTELALKNALRYVPPEWHATLAPEFLRGAHHPRAHLRLPLPAAGADHGPPARPLHGQLHRRPGLPGHDRQQPGLRGRALPL